MKILNSKDLLQLMNNATQNSIKINDVQIDIEDHLDINLNIDSIEFNNCFFRGGRIDFYDFVRNDDIKDQFCSLSFVDCIFVNDLYIKNCCLHSLEFKNVHISSDNFSISSSDINRISIVGSPGKYNKIFSLTLNNLSFKKTSIDIRLNNFEKMIYINNCIFREGTINANIIERIHILNSIFEGSFSFWRNQLISESFIKNSSFNELKGDNSNYGEAMNFNEIKFLGNCNFESVQNKRTLFKFSKCNFDKYVYFDKSDVFEISFDTAFFKEIVSFQNLNCDKIKLNRTHFDKVAFFNDINIRKPDNCDLKTIRLIKNHLLKIENKIDYLKYSAIEQNNLLRSSKLNVNDRILLNLNKQSNDFGNNWILGIKFTVKRGIQFFLLLLIVNNFVISKYPLSFNFKGQIASYSQILTEFLKFIFSLGFDNKEIQSNGFLYLIFIVAKIFIGYGIYQTISAFRKYGKS